MSVYYPDPRKVEIVCVLRVGVFYCPNPSFDSRYAAFGYETKITARIDTLVAEKHSD